MAVFLFLSLSLWSLHRIEFTQWIWKMSEKTVAIRCVCVCSGFSFIPLKPQTVQSVWVFMATTNRLIDIKMKPYICSIKYMHIPNLAYQSFALKWSLQCLFAVALCGVYWSSYCRCVHIEVNWNVIGTVWFKKWLNFDSKRVFVTLCSQIPMIEQVVGIRPFEQFECGPTSHIRFTNDKTLSISTSCVCACACVV